MSELQFRANRYRGSRTLKCCKAGCRNDSCCLAYYYFFARALPQCSSAEVDDFSQRTLYETVHERVAANPGWHLAVRPTRRSATPGSPEICLA